MLKQVISFKDFNGADRTVTEYFHLSEQELIDLSAESKDGLQADMQKAVLSNDAKQVLDFIKKMVHTSYGQRSADGVYFRKSDEILRDFIDSAYYSDFMVSLIVDNGKKGEEFMTGIMPPDLVARATAQAQGQPVGEVDRTVYGNSAREEFAAQQAQRVEPLTTQPQPEPVAQATQPVDADYQRYLAWKAQQDAANAAPASPDAFRVREEEQPMQGLPRPPHEQAG